MTFAPYSIGIGPTLVDKPQVIADGADGVTLGPGGFTSFNKLGVTLFDDASDDTYVEHWRSGLDVTPAGLGSMAAEVKPIPDGTIDKYPLTVRAMMKDEGTVGDPFVNRFFFDVYRFDEGSWLGWFSFDYEFGVQLPTSDAIYTVNPTFVPNVDDPFNPKTVEDLNIAMQTDGLVFNFSAAIGSATGVKRMLRVYEMYLGDYELVAADLAADIDRTQALFQGAF